MIFSLGLLSDYKYNKVNQKSDMKSLPKKSPKSISKVRKSGVQISRGEVFKLAGVLTNTYNTNTYCRRFLGKDTPTR